MPPPAGGVPDSVAVPSPLSVSESHEGLSLKARVSGSGKPGVVDTVKELGWLADHVTWLALVKAGAWSTVKVIEVVAGVPTPLDAVKVIG